MWISETVSTTYEIAKQFKEQELVLLTESDLKAVFATRLGEKVPQNVTVNTESPWYDTYITNSTFFIDVTAFDSDKLQLTYDSITRRKGYKYTDEAVVIELKYFRYSEDINSIKGDFNKMKSLTKSSMNNCFIIAAARTKELFDAAAKFMTGQMLANRLEYKGRLKVYLFDNDNILEIN